MKKVSLDWLNTHEVDEQAAQAAIRRGAHAENARKASKAAAEKRLGTGKTEAEKAQARKEKYQRTHVSNDRGLRGKHRKGATMSEEARLKISLAQLGKRVGPFSDDHKAQLKKAAAVKLTCPHCGKQAARGPFGLWHGDNCKHKM